MKYVLVYKVDTFNLWLAVYELENVPDSEGYVMGYKRMGFGEERLAYVHPTMRGFATLEEAVLVYKSDLYRAKDEITRRAVVLNYQLNELNKLIEAT